MCSRSDDWIDDLSSGRATLLGGTLQDIVKWKHAYMLREQGRRPSPKCNTCKGSGTVVVLPYLPERDAPDVNVDWRTDRCPTCKGSGGHA